MSALIKAAALEIGDGCRAKNNEFAPSGLPFARAGNIKDGFQFAETDRFPEENLERIGNKISEPGDVVFTSKGTVGRFACVREDIPQFVYSPQLCFWRSATSWFGYRDHLYRIHIEDAALAWLESLGWSIAHGSDIAWYTRSA